MSNLLKDASILLTPTAYDNGRMNAIKPGSGDGDFDFQRNSAATRVNAQGLVENVQIISPELVSNGNFSEIGTEEVLNGNFSQEGSELITNGDFATNSDWNFVGDGSISNEELILPCCIFNNRTSQNSVSMNSSKSYKLEINITQITSGDTIDYLQGGVWYTFGTQLGINTAYITNPPDSALYLRNSDGVGTIKIDNVSVKEVGQNCDLGTGWSIGDDKVIATDVNSAFQQLNILTIGKSYKITYTILDYVSGSVRFRANLVNGATNSANGTYTDYIVVASSKFALQGINNFNGSITNISVKEVGQDWSIGTGWSIDQANSKAVFDGGADSAIQQSSVLTSGLKYKLSLDVLDRTTGSLQVRFGSTASVDEAIDANGTFTYVLISDGTSLYLRSVGGFDGSVTNISVKEITDDTNIPRINYEGFSYQDSLGSELVVNGTFDDGGANWTQYNPATFENSSVIFSNNSRIMQYSVATLGKPYNAEISFSNISGDGITVYWGNGFSKNYSVNDIVNNNNKITENKIYFLSNGNLFIYSKSSSTSATITNVSVKEYLGQEVVPDSGCGSWLLEGQGTNLITYSEDFNNSYWSKSSNVTITQNYGVSPDGTQNSTRIQGDAGSIIYRSGFIATDSRSIYVRATSGSGTIQALSHNTNTNNIFNINENWKRVEVNSTPLVSGNFYVVDFRGASTDIFDIEVWGAQSENQSYATSYIPTNGATNTRLKDIATNSGNSSLINSTEGVLYTEMSSLANDGTNKYITINDGGTTDYLFFRYRSDNNFQVKLRSANTDKVNQTLTLPDNLDLNKIAFSYKENEFKIFVNGLQIGNTITTGATSAANTLNRVDFSRYDGASNFIGKNKALAVYKEALTDASLRCLTYPNPVATTFDLDFDTIAEQFTFTRGSEATFVNAQGLIESTNQLGPELVTNGDFATDSDWNKGTSWAISGGKANYNAVTTSSELRQLMPSIAVGKTIKVQFDVLDVAATKDAFFKLECSGSPESIFGYTKFSQGTYTYYHTITSGFDRLTFTPLNSSTGGAFSIDNVSVKEVTTATNTPRIDYSTGEKAFLLEPQSTNLINYSEDFSNSSWGKTNSSITSNSIISPDGTLNADKLVENTSTGEKFTQDIVSVSNATIYTASVFVKFAGREWIRFTDAQSSNRIHFNTKTGVFGTVTGTVISYNSIALDNGWYKLSLTTTSVATAYAMRIVLAKNDNDVSYQGDGTSGVYVWGAQLEQQSYNTSYIPTDGASATRNQELCNNATPVINSEEGTLYAEISALADDLSFRTISISDGTTSNRCVLRYGGTTNYVNVLIFSGGSSVFDNNYALSDITDFSKIAVKWKENDFALWVNGVERKTDTSGSSPIGLSELQLSNYNNSSNPFY